MITGRIKYFNLTRGFGFIDDGSGEDIYVHYTSISDRDVERVTIGAMVSFEVMQTQRGREAFNVSLHSLF